MTISNNNNTQSRQHPLAQNDNNNNNDDDDNNNISSTRFTTHMCRICLGNDAPLISPCLCNGSMRYVHQECLNQWRHTDTHGERFKKCETCKLEYRFQHTSILSSISTSKTGLLLLSLFLFAIVMLLAGYVGKFTLMRLMENEHQSQKYLIEKSENRWRHMVEVTLAKKATPDSSQPNTSPVSSHTVTTLDFATLEASSLSMCESLLLKKREQGIDTTTTTITTTSDNVRRRKNKSKKNNGSESFTQDDLCYERANLDRLNKNSKKMREWMRQWRSGFMRVDILHVVMGCITMSFFGIFHLITFWRAYFDWFADHIMITTHQTSAGQVVTATTLSAGNVASSGGAFSMVETYLFAIFVCLGLLKSFFMFQRLVHWGVNRLSIYMGETERIMNYEHNHDDDGGRFSGNNTSNNETCSSSVRDGGHQSQASTGTIATLVQSML